MDILTKVCTKCGKEKLNTIEYFYEVKKGINKLRSECKDCSHKRQRKYYKKNRKKELNYAKEYRNNHKEYIKEYREKLKKSHDWKYYRKMPEIWKKENYMKKCSQCKEMKKYDEFYVDKGNTDGLHYRCIECIKKNSRKWRKKNPKKYKQQLNDLHNTEWTLKNLGLSWSNLRIGKGYSQYDILKNNDDINEKV